jgi:hypothetical protein
MQTSTDEASAVIEKTVLKSQKKKVLDFEKELEEQNLQYMVELYGSEFLVEFYKKRSKAHSG